MQPKFPPAVEAKLTGGLEAHKNAAGETVGTIHDLTDGQFVYWDRIMGVTSIVYRSKSDLLQWYK
jgi:hypothetical protein